MQRIIFSLMIAVCTLFQSGPALSLELETLLQKMSANSAKIDTLQANFTQEKQLSFLKKPLRSEGHFFFNKSLNQSPSILWEYLKPAPSGIFYQNNEGFIWMQNRSSLKKAEGYEGNVLNTMIKQMLLWFVFEPKTLKSHYNMSLKPSNNANDNACIELTPLVENFFSSLLICVSNSDYHISSLQFNEKNGDSTNLYFTDILTNKAFPATFPDGTAFP